MTLRRSLVAAIAVAVLAMSGASAQFAPPGVNPPCFDEFAQLRDEAQNRMKAAHDAGKRKPTPQEMCRLIDRYAEAEAQLLKFVEDHGHRCSIPPQTAEKVKAVQVKTIEARKRVCGSATPPKRIRIAAFSPDFAH